MKLPNIELLLGGDVLFFFRISFLPVELSETFFLNVSLKFSVFVFAFLFFIFFSLANNQRTLMNPGHSDETKRSPRKGKDI